MSNWILVNKTEPCGICGKDDWCRRGEKGWGCMRVESPYPTKAGGWFHPFDSNHNQTPVVRPQAPQAKPYLNASAMMQKIISESVVCHSHLANQIGVTTESLIALDAAWDKNNSAWAFPMRDGEGKIIGIRLRTEDGRKWAVPGSKQGIFLPFFQVQEFAPGFICEGPTDTAAALSMGLFAVGRPSCQCGGDQIIIGFKRLKIRKSVIISDADGPGLLGSQKLSADLAANGIRNVIWIPPTKDIREFYRIGGSKEMIEKSLKDSIWRVK